MDNGNNYLALGFAMQLVQLYLVDDRNNVFVNESDLYHTTDALVRIMSHGRQPPPEGLAGLIETLRINQDPSTYLGERMPLGPTAHIHAGMMQVRVGQGVSITFVLFYLMLSERPMQFIKNYGTS